MILTMLLKSLVLLLTIIHSAFLSWKTYQDKTFMPFIQKVKVALSSIIAFLADTIGIGSFAINIAFAKALKTIPTEKLPGFVNASQVLPGTIQSFIFMQMVDVDILTLCILASAATVGGMLGALFISRLNATALKKCMIICFSGMIVLLVTTEVGLLDIGGNATSLSGLKLLLTALAMTVAGMLSAACVGLYATSQAILFLAGITPLAAFPIMMTAGALQQPVLALTFLQKDKVPLKETVIASLAGILGIAIGLPLITSVSIHALHYLLICVLFYNIFAIANSLQEEKALITDTEN